MYVSNLTNRRLGLGGPFVLRPKEKNFYIDEENEALVAAAYKAKAANLVSISKVDGLIKTVTSNAVKMLSFDEGSVGTKPRTSPEKKKVEVIKEKVEEPKVEETKIEEPVVETPVEDIVAEIPAETPVEDTVVETPTEMTEVKPTKKGKKKK